MGNRQSSLGNRSKNDSSGDRGSTVSIIPTANTIQHDNLAKRPSVTSHTASKAVYHVVVYVSYGIDLDASPDSALITAVVDNSAAVIQSTQRMPHPRQPTDYSTVSNATSCSLSTGVKNPGFKNPVAIRRYAFWSISPTLRTI
jgi:hypothetical protein